MLPGELRALIIKPVDLASHVFTAYFDLFITVTATSCR